MVEETAGEQAERVEVLSVKVNVLEVGEQREAGSGARAEGPELRRHRRAQ